MKEKNRYLKRICSLAGTGDPHEGVKAFVAKHRQAWESLGDIARKLGITEISEEKLPFEGGIFRRDDGNLVIKINIDSSNVRKRFTLAHEVGHILLNTVPAFRGTDCADRPLEATCDMIAAELLMPADETTTYVQSLGRPSPEKLRLIASRYSVSVHAAAVRVHSGLRLWKCFVGMWECQPKVKTEWFVGRRLWDRTEPDSSSLDLALSSLATVESKEYWYRGPAAQPIWLKLLRISDARVLGLIGFVSHA